MDEFDTLNRSLNTDSKAGSNWPRTPAAEVDLKPRLQLRRTLVGS